MNVAILKNPANNRSFTASVTFDNPQEPWSVDWGDGAVDNNITAASKTHVYTVIGAHEITVFSDDVSSTHNVFAGDYPVFDADSYKKTPVEVIANQRMNAAKIRATTGVLNG